MPKIAIHDLPVQRGWGRGWGMYILTCPNCGYREEGVQAAVGSCNHFTCPMCRNRWYIEWPPHQSEMPNDGAWLTGSIDGDF